MRLGLLRCVRWVRCRRRLGLPVSQGRLLLLRLLRVAGHRRLATSSMIERARARCPSRATRAAEVIEQLHLAHTVAVTAEVLSECWPHVHARCSRLLLLLLLRRRHSTDGGDRVFPARRVVRRGRAVLVAAAGAALTAKVVHDAHTAHAVPVHAEMFPRSELRCLRERPALPLLLLLRLLLLLLRLQLLLLLLLCRSGRGRRHREVRRRGSDAGTRDRGDEHVPSSGMVRRLLARRARLAVGGAEEVFLRHTARAVAAHAEMRHFVFERARGDK